MAGRLLLLLYDASWSMRSLLPYQIQAYRPECKSRGSWQKCVGLILKRGGWKGGEVSVMWLSFAFAMLGLLIGTLVGLTSENVVQSLIALLFALMGGSVIALLGKLSTEDRKAASQAIASLSIACLVGIYSGIIVTQYHLLSPRVDSKASQVTSKTGSGSPVTSRAEISNERYVRSAITDKANAIDIKYKGNLISLDQAYEEMYLLAKKSAEQGASQ